MDNNYRKYLKYKNKYKQLVGGGANPNDDECKQIHEFLTELMTSQNSNNISKNGGAEYILINGPTDPINDCLKKNKELILSAVISSVKSKKNIMSI